MVVGGDKLIGEGIIFHSLTRRYQMLPSFIGNQWKVVSVRNGFAGSYPFH